MSQQKVHIVLWKEDDQWVAWCIEFDVASQGDNEEHALAMIQEAVELHTEDMSPEEVEQVYIPVDSPPIVREITVRAPAVLNR
jgi:predicted RNase H-like HicB family nuclease